MNRRGLFVRSLANLLTFSVDPTLSGHKPPQAKAFYKQLMQQLSVVPGVRSAALCVVPPLTYDE